MSYCSSAEIEADFKDITFTTTTLVKAADVTQFIVEADALINSYIGMKYVVPVSGGMEALALLKLYSRTIVSERIKGLMEVKQAKNTDGNQNVRTGLSVRDVLKLLADIRDSKTELIDAVKLTPSGLFYSNNYANSEEPIMLKNTKQW